MAKRTDIVVLMIQYDGSVPEDVLAIHEQVELEREGVVRVRAAYGVGSDDPSKTTQVGMSLGSCPKIHEAKRVG